MKRILDGATYNTDTATAVANGVIEDGDTVTEVTLYQTRTGIYFNVDEITTQRRGRNGEVQERTAFEWEVIGDAAKARAWCELYGLTITRDIEDMPDEAKPGEKLATVYMRVTPTLKKELDEVASEEKVSGNLWATKCLERCLTLRQANNLKELGEINYISGVASHADWPIELHRKAAQHIKLRIEELAAKVLGDEEGLHKMAVSLTLSNRFEDPKAL